MRGVFYQFQVILKEERQFQVKLHKELIDREAMRDIPPSLKLEGGDQKAVLLQGDQRSAGCLKVEVCPADRGHPHIKAQVKGTLWILD